MAHAATALWKWSSYPSAEWACLSWEPPAPSRLILAPLTKTVLQTSSSITRTLCPWGLQHSGEWHLAYWLCHQGCINTSEASSLDPSLFCFYAQWPKRPVKSFTCTSFWKLYFYLQSISVRLSGKELIFGAFPTDLLVVPQRRPSTLLLFTAVFSVSGTHCAQVRFARWMQMSWVLFNSLKLLPSFLCPSRPRPSLAGGEDINVVFQGFGSNWDAYVGIVLPKEETEARLEVRSAEGSESWKDRAGFRHFPRLRRGTVFWEVAQTCVHSHAEPQWSNGTSDGWLGWRVGWWNMRRSGLTLFLSRPLEVQLSYHKFGMRMGTCFQWQHVLFYFLVSYIKMATNTWIKTRSLPFHKHHSLLNVVERTMR